MYSARMQYRNIPSPSRRAIYHHLIAAQTHFLVIHGEPAPYARADPVCPVPHGTVFAAGSLQGPGWGSAPMARMRTYIRAPLVRPVMWIWGRCCPTSGRCQEPSAMLGDAVCDSFM